MTRPPPNSPFFPPPPLSRSPLLPNHPPPHPLRPADHHALPHEDLGVPPADAGEIHIPLVVHVRDLQPDLVDVAGQHETGRARSEEHTSELQSPCNLVCRLLLEKKKNDERARDTVR